MIARMALSQKDFGYHRRIMNDILEYMLKKTDDSQNGSQPEGFWILSENNE